MTSEKTITLTRREYDALIERNSQLEDMLAAQDADDGVRVGEQSPRGRSRHYAGEGSHPGVSEPPGHHPEGTV